MPTRKMVRKSYDSPFYLPNHFIICLDSETPFLVFEADETNRQDNKFLSIFVHEYWHYLHNITTVSGFKSFAFTQHLLYLFSETIQNNRNGTSNGNADLSGAEAADLAALIGSQLVMEGHAGPMGFESDWDVTSSVKDLEEKKTPFLYKGNTIINPFHVVHVECS